MYFSDFLLYYSSLTTVSGNINELKHILYLRRLLKEIKYHTESIGFFVTPLLHSFRSHAQRVP